MFSPEQLLGAALPVDADLVLVQLLAGATDAEVSTQLPAQAMSTLPRLVATTFPATGIDGPLLHLRAGIQLDAWAETREQASAICRQAVAVLVVAQATQRVVAGGHLRRLTLSASPGEVRLDDQPDGVWRFSASLVGIFRAA